ncbi:hypothetical protein I5G62_gp63 [Mycobacterium phage CRB2]|uniref:Uncharacterized protein n=1 Tax=Mycobacterium phage CRB2 TaxID=2483623 RepID=A0A455M3S0_9CAUD|nr:hypothetical protein I5G62_gp63 [Mycobacterium phage CRB2]AYP70049.1 hypothetical protein CRB2_63 [Mycobacterium phage CRB2]
MTTTKGRKATRKAPEDARDETLAQFAKMVDDHHGSAVGFDRLVKELARARAQIAQVKAARDEVFSVVKARFEEGHRIAGPGVELRLTAAGEAKIERAVESAAVKKHNPAAWRRAQADVPYVQVKAPAAAKLAIELIPTPTVNEDWPVEKAVEVYQHDPAWVRLKELREIEEETLAKLDKLAADFGWDGHPITFSDGWSIGLRRKQFSAAKLAELEPEVFEALAVSKVRQATPRVYVASTSADGATDAIAD